MVSRKSIAIFAVAFLTLLVLALGIWRALPDTEHGKYWGAIIGSLIGAVMALLVVELNRGRDERKEVREVERLRSALWLETRLVAYAALQEFNYWITAQSGDAVVDTSDLSTEHLNPAFIRVSIPKLTSLAYPEQQEIILLHDNLAITREQLVRIAERDTPPPSNDIDTMVSLCRTCCRNCKSLLAALDEDGRRQRLWAARPDFREVAEQEFRRGFHRATMDDE